MIIAILGILAAIVGIAISELCVMIERKAK
jgi:hypothetical protein